MQKFHIQLSKMQLHFGVFFNPQQSRLSACCVLHKTNKIWHSFVIFRRHSLSIQLPSRVVHYRNLYDKRKRIWCKGIMRSKRESHDAYESVIFPLY